jgi:hypothetical protein
VAAEQFEQHTGGGEVLVEGTMGQPLLFIRAGSILPLDDAWADGRQPSEVLTESHAPQALTFHVFADERGSARGSNFDDAGDGDGPTRTDHLVLEGDLVRWGFDGSFERPSSVSIVLHGMTITAARVDGRPLGAEHVRVGQLGTVLTVPSFERLELLRR